MRFAMRLNFKKAGITRCQPAFTIWTPAKTVEERNMFLRNFRANREELFFSFIKDKPDHTAA
jgi:hypothetical protein